MALFSAEYDKLDDIVKDLMKYMKEKWGIKLLEMDVVFEEGLRRVVMEKRVKGSFGK